MIADTCFIIDLLKGDKKAIELYNELSQVPILPSICAYEVLVGAYIISQKRADEAKQLISTFDVRPMTDKIANSAAKICAELIKQGKEIQDNDCMIAAFEENPTVITRNKSHFSRITGVSIMSY